MIILQKETTEHREPWTSTPQGEPGPPPSVLTPQSSPACTATRAVGVGTLYRDTIFAATAETELTRKRISPGDTTLGSTLTHIAGGSSLPSAQGIFPKAACARRARMRAGLFGGCSGLLQPVWVRGGPMWAVLTTAGQGTLMPT